jgi:Family of unknown function (DUF6113)
VELTPRQPNGQAPEAPEAPESPQGAGNLVAVSAYAMLFLLGALQSVLGSFHYAGMLGPVPAAALGFDVALLVTCVLGSWGMRRPTGGLMPAVGWFVASFVLSMGTRGGSVVITDTPAGKWFLFGGSACAVAGALICFSRLSPARGGATRRVMARGGREPGGVAAQFDHRPAQPPDQPPAEPPGQKPGA